jgi:HEAT repeat protein
MAGSEEQPEVEPKKSLQELTEQALHAPEEQDRIAALQALHEQYPEKEVLPIFVTALQDKAEKVRLTALDLLSNSAAFEGGEPVPYAPVASLATQDSSPRVRRLALKVASDIDPKASTELLKKAVDDPDPALARLARVILKSRTARPLPPEVEKKLRSQQP